MNRNVAPSPRYIRIKTVTAKTKGFKGVNLCEMSQIGINVTSNFVISTFWFSHLDSWNVEYYA
jgi:hypothetical protein